MKRLVAILTFILALSSGASAQWYLFPLDKAKKEKQAEKSKVKEAEKAAPAAPSQNEAPATIIENPEVLPEERTMPADSLDEFVLDIPEEVRVTMLLPVNAGQKPRSNFLEMCAGAMLAARDLGRQGVKMSLSIVDCIGEESEIDETLLASSDVIIGPVSSEDLMKVLDRCPAGKRLVSPLEPKAAALADSCNIVQAPSSWADQIDEMIEWVKEENVAGDQIVLIKDSVEAGEQTKYLLRKLAESGIQYKSSYLASDVTPSAIGTTRYIIASDRDAYVATAMRQIGIATIRMPAASLVVYLTSKMRNAKGLDTQYLYKTSSRVTMSYFTDYDDSKVKDFVLAYRALFQDDPASFAFQGYDTVSYFTKACTQFGRQWYKKLPEIPSYEGLQSSYSFKERVSAGQVNRAVRRVIYKPDFSTARK